MIDITLLGTGGGMPTANRFLSSLLISYKGRKILVDCGEGTQVSMRMCNAGFKTIDYIFITHVHGDHIIGLPGLLATIGNSGRTEPLTIIGPEGITEAVNGLMVICRYLPFHVNIIEAPKEDIEIHNGDIRISFLEADHNSPCLSYSFYFKRSAKFDVEKALSNNVPKLLWNRLQKSLEDIEYEGITYSPSMVMGRARQGIKISMVTDSRPLESMKDFINNSDLFVCEGTYGDSFDIEKAIKNKHMTFFEASTLAKEGNVKKLLLTHFSVAMNDAYEFKENAVSNFTNSIIGEDRMSFTLNFPEEN